MRHFAALVLFGFATAFVSFASERVLAAPVPRHLMKEPASDKADRGEVEGAIIADGRQGHAGAPRSAIRYDVRVQRRDRGRKGQWRYGPEEHRAVKYGSRAARQIKITDTHTVDGDGKPVNTSNGQDGGEVGYAFEGEKLLLGSAGNGKGAVDPLNPGPTDIVIVLVRVK